MKHFISTISACFLTAITLLSQNKGITKSSIAFSSGISMPIGKMAESNYRDSSSGFGKQASMFRLQYQYDMEGGWAYYIQAQYTGIGFDYRKYRAAHYEKTNWKSESSSSENYFIGSLNMGVSYEIYRKKRLSIAPYAGVGISYCKNRTFDFTQSYEGLTMHFKEKSDLVNCKNVQYGINAIYNINKRMSFLLNFGFQHQSPQYQNTKTTTVQAEGSNSVENTVVNSFKLQQNFSAFSAGFKFRLGRI